MMHTLTLFCADKQCEVDFNCVYVIIQAVFIMRCFSLQNKLPICNGGGRHCNILQYVGWTIRRLNPGRGMRFLALQNVRIGSDAHRGLLYTGYRRCPLYRGAAKSLARPPSRCILFDG